MLFHSYQWLNEVYITKLPNIIMTVLHSYYFLEFISTETESIWNEGISRGADNRRLSMIHSFSLVDD